MLDFTWSDHTLVNVLYCIVIYSVFILLFYKRYVTNGLVKDPQTNKFLLFAAFVLIVTACIDGDWFHYRDMVMYYDFSEGAQNYGERIYWYIIKLVKQNYLLFRIVVWGAAFIITIFSFKRFNIDINIAVFFLIAVFLVKFNYARATLGMASCCMAVSYLLKPKKGPLLVNLALAALFFWGAYEFHHSVLILVALCIVTIYLPIDKPIIVIVLLFLMPFFAAFLKDNLILVDQLENEYLSDKLEQYLDRSSGASNLLGIIAGFIGYGVFAVPILLDTIVIVQNRKRIPVSFIRLYRIIISTSILAVSFSFMGLESSVFVYRILFMAFIPLTILTVYLFENHFLSKKRYTYCVLWGMFAISFKLLQLFWDYR